MGFFTGIVGRKCTLNGYFLHFLSFQVQIFYINFFLMLFRVGQIGVFEYSDKKEIAATVAQVSTVVSPSLEGLKS